MAAMERPWLKPAATPQINSSPILTYIAVAPNGGSLQHDKQPEWHKTRTYNTQQMFTFDNARNVQTSMKSLFISVMPSLWWHRGTVLECQTCNQEVVGLSLSRAHAVKTLRKFLTPTCLCHQAV